MKKYLYSILTVITNGYETLREIDNPNPEVEYVCVTNNKNIESKTWKVIYKEKLWFLDVKHNQYDYVSSDVCLWLDGSYKIINDPTNDFVKPFIESDKELMISLHDKRSNLFDELCAWWVTRNVPTENIKCLCTILSNNEVSGKTGLFQTSCMLTKNTKSIKRLFEEIRRVEKNCSVVAPYRDDQVIFSFVIDKLFYKWDKMVLLNFESTSLNEFFYMCRHGQSLLPAGPFALKTNLCWGEPQKLFRIGIDNLEK